MKQLVTFLITILFFTNAFSQDCNIGNETSTADFTTGSFTANFLLGTKYTLAEEGTLNSINLLGNDTGALVKMAVYDDNAGAPNNLIATSGPATVGSGVVSLAVTPVVLPAGDYWIMSNYDASGGHTNVNSSTSAASSVVYYSSLAFDNPMPATWAGSASFTGQDISYFLDITCTPAASACNIGNETSTADFTTGSFTANFLLGTKYTLAEEGTLNSINLLGNDTGALVKMAVYDDNAGAPNNLIATSGPATVGSGVVSLAVTPVVLPAGDYWIMSNYDASGGHTNVNSSTSAASSVVYYSSLAFDNPMPATWAGSASFTGQDISYFLDITCTPAASTCNIGNETSTADFTTGSFTANFLLGTKYTLAEEGTLNSINLLGNDTGALVKMAVYDDNAGAPNNLIATSGPATVGSGVVSLAVTPVVLPAGDYWIMSNYDASGGHTNVNSSTSAASSVVYYSSLAFDNPMPATWAGSASFTGQDISYFLDITCGNTLGVEDVVFNNKLSLYPNPSSNVINVSGLKRTEKYLIFNVLGKKVLKGTIQPNEQINVQNLKKGLYIIKFESGTSLKFIKN